VKPVGGVPFGHSGHSGPFVTVPGFILYYFEEMTMKEIGSALDLSESRVSQMHSSILARLKAQMADRRKEL